MKFRRFDGFNRALYLSVFQSAEDASLLERLQDDFAIQIVVVGSWENEPGLYPCQVELECRYYRCPSWSHPRQDPCPYQPPKRNDEQLLSKSKEVTSWLRQTWKLKGLLGWSFDIADSSSFWFGFLSHGLDPSADIMTMCTALSKGTVMWYTGKISTQGPNNQTVTSSIDLLTLI